MPFCEGIRPEDMSMRREGDDFLFIHKNGGDQVSIKNVFNGYSGWDGGRINDNQVVEKITFSDGTVWNWDQIVSQGIISYVNNNGEEFNGLRLNDITYGSKSDDVINGHGGDDVIYGGDGNDILDGGIGSNQLYGDAGDDILQVDEKYSSNNILAGGSGNDILYGSYNDDTYIFNLGDGQDQIIEPDHNYNNGFDTLHFGEGIRPEDINIRWEGNDLLFIHSNGDDQVLIKDVFFEYPHWNGSWINDEKIIEQITFSDGTIWHWHQVILQGVIIHSNNSGISHGLEGDDIIYREEENDMLNSDAGDDVLQADDSSENNLLVGSESNDFIDVDTDNDFLYGNFYADTYVFNRGDGQDTIIEYGYNYYLPEVPINNEKNTISDSTENHSIETSDFLSEEDWASANNSWMAELNNDQAIDKLLFGEDISEKDLWFKQKDKNLIIKIIGTDDQVLIENWYEGKGFRIEEFHTADGRVLLESEVNKMVQAMADFAPQVGGAYHLTVIPPEQLESIISVHWQ